ncbi:MAG TPA: alpha/beta fold hydrolase [Thermoanaerobaculia bacterium]|nr:alpha/beta fold hydrolase [Thermoanaerobaculia bacterium]
MRLKPLFFANVMVLTFACTTATPRPHAGFYGGGFGIPPDFLYTQVKLETNADGSLKGTLWQPYERVGGFPLGSILVDGPRLRFAFEDMKFDLRQTGIGYRGIATRGGVKYPASFVIRPGSPPTQSLAPFEGTYDLGGGRTFTFSRNNANGAPWFLELPSGRTGYLYNISPTEFVAGRCFYCVEPLAYRVALSVEGMRVNGRVVPRDTRIHEEHVTFSSADGTTIAGTLFLPRGAGPHPAVVFAHGSGAQTRNGFYGQIRFMAEAYARRGIAALAYDKRGTGASKGDWERANFSALADDLVAGVRLLRTRSDIDPQRIGLTGSSQAGLVIALALEHVTDVRLIQLRSTAAPMGVLEQERARIVLQMRADGYPQPEIDRAVRIRDMMDDYAKTGAGWNELATEFKKVERELWAAHFLGGLPPQDSPDWPWLREAFTYDVTKYFERLPGSVQALYGARDTPIPPEESRARLEAALKRGGSRDYELLVIPDATHNYYVGRTGGDREFPALSRYVPGHFDMVVEWAVQALRPLIFQLSCAKRPAAPGRRGTRGRRTTRRSRRRRRSSPAPPGSGGGSSRPTSAGGRTSASKSMA